MYILTASCTLEIPSSPHICMHRYATVPIVDSIRLRLPESSNVSNIHMRVIQGVADPGEIQG